MGRALRLAGTCYHHYFVFFVNVKQHVLKCHGRGSLEVRSCVTRFSAVEFPIVRMLPYFLCVLSGRPCLIYLLTIWVFIRHDRCYDYILFHHDYRPRVYRRHQDKQIIFYHRLLFIDVIASNMSIAFGVDLIFPKMNAGCCEEEIHNCFE